MSQAATGLDPALSQARAVRTVLVVTLLLNVLVAVAKIVYGDFAAALAIRADGFHSLTDSANNVVGLVAVWLASRPADEGHPYGHHKYEVLAAGFVGVSLLAMAFDVARSAIERVTAASPELPRIDVGAFVVLISTLAVNLFVATWELRRGRALQSPFLLSDSAHTRSDVFVTIGVLATAALVQQGLVWLDLIAALAIAAFIAWTGVRVLLKNLSYLTDTVQIDPARVEEIVLTVPGVASTHKIRTRGVPGTIYLDLHIQIAPHLDVVQAHRVTHAVIDALKQQVGGVYDVIVHTEPARPDQPYRPLPEEPEG
jgi:cation diffusion facilitator family transporter